MKCAFCKRDFDIPYGTTIIQRDGTPKHFCSSKCRKNSKMGRDNKKVKWVTKMPENKAAKEESKAINLARQEKIFQENKANNKAKAERKNAKVKRAKAKEEKK